MTLTPLSTYEGHAEQKATNLIHHLNALILLFHLQHLLSAGLFRNKTIERDHKNHDCHTPKDSIAHLCPQEVQRQSNLDRGGPDHMEIRGKVHEALCVREQV
jgi:hypothetical protein